MQSLVKRRSLTLPALLESRHRSFDLALQCLDRLELLIGELVLVQDAPATLQPLADIANVEHFLPKDWISEDGFLPNEKFMAYARPLIEGEVKVPMEGGLPKFVRFEKVRVEKKLPPRM